MLKKLISLVLLVTFSVFIISPAFAIEIPDISEQPSSVSDEFLVQNPGEELQSETVIENTINNNQVEHVDQSFSVLNLEDYKTQEELRQAIIGDETWVENFPNGLFNFIGTQFQVNETNEFFEIAVVRQGGTQGKVTIDFKAIDISAEYGKDYIIRVYENSGKNEIDKNEESMPLMQTIGDNAAINISESVSDRETNEESESTEEEIPQEDVQTIDDDEIGAEVANSAEPLYTDLAESVVTVGEGSGKAISSLREARDTYLGQKSDRPDWKTIDAGKVEELKTAYDKFLYNAPGVEATLEFDEGEYIKYLYFIPLNDTLSESEEQVMFALERPGNGACRGEFYMSYVNITDDEVPETPIFEIQTPSVVAKDGIASIVVKRMGGLQQYASVVIGTEEGTAFSGVDYEPGLKELFFPPGTSEQIVSVNVLDNPARVMDRHFMIALDRTSNQINQDAAAALVTIPGLPKTQTVTPSSLEVKESIRSLAGEPTNINAEQLSPYGYSPAKGKWLVTGEDFLKAGWTSDHAILPQSAGNGLYYDYTNNLGNQIIGYDLGSLGGIDSIGFNYWNHGKGDNAGRYDYTFSINTGRGSNYASLRTQDFQGYTDPTSSEMKVFLGNPNYVTENNLFLLSRCIYYQYTRPVISDITLNLKEYQLDVLPAATISLLAYKIENGKMSYQGKYKDLIPGELHLERIDSNVGNHQKADLDNNFFIDHTKVYRSDRIQFSYDYSEANPHGKYAEFTGLELKTKDEYGKWVFFKGTELVLDADFFKKFGVGDGVNLNKIEIRPAFAQKKASLEMKIDTQYGYLNNLANLQDKDRTYSRQTDPSAPQLYTGDVIRGLELVSEVTTSKRPTWASRAGLSADMATSSNGVVITEKVNYSQADYYIEDVYNQLILGFNVNLIIMANPNTYKDSVTMPSYKLDGVAYADRDALMEALEKTCDKESGQFIKNPTLEMEFAYVFDKNVPRPTDLGTPQEAILKVYRKDGTERGSYSIEPVVPGSNSFNFTCRPQEKGWQLDDYASLRIYGDLIIDNQRSSTQEMVIDFLGNSRDGIIVTPPSGDNKSILCADIKTPLHINDANPLEYYTMQAIASPGFEVSWQDGSPDLNNDGQVDYDEEAKALQRLQKFYPDLKDLNKVWSDQIYWNYLSYMPNYFDPSIIYYSFERLTTGTIRWDVGIKLFEKYNTVLNPNFASSIDPIRNAEVYFGKKRIEDSDGDGVYKDSGLYRQGKCYPGQLVYGNQVYNFAVIGGRPSLECTINTSTLMMPKDFHAVITKESKSVDQNLGITRTNLNIEDAVTTFSYRVDSSGAGVKANNSIVRIYDADHNLFLERRTGAPSGGMFSLDLNTAQEGIGSDFSMTIAGVYEQKDQTGNTTLFKEYPEVRVGLKFSRAITALSILAGFVSDKQPVIKMIGKLNNKYDLGMDLVIDDNDDASLQNYTDKEGRDRYYKFITFGYNGTYEKKIEENTKETEENGDDGNVDLLKEDTDQVSKEDGLKSKVNDATTKKSEPNQPVTKGSGGGDFSMEYKISLALTWEKKKDPTDGSFYTRHYFNSLVLMATATFPGYKKEHTYITPIGLPITVSLKADGSASAVLAFEADRKDDPYDEKYQLEDSKGIVHFKPQNYNIYTKFMIYPTIHLDAETGQGDVTVSVGGKAQFDLVFNAPIRGDNVKSSGSGGVTISASLKLELLFIEKKWTLYSHDRIKLFEYGSLQESMLAALSNPYQNYLYEKVAAIDNEDIMNRDYLAVRDTWNSAGSNQLLQGAHTVTETLLQRGVFPCPQTRLVPIDDHKTLLLFIDDDTSRDARNRASLKYSLLENGNSTAPVALDNNGTWDKDPDAFKVGDRILVTWSDADRVYTQEDTQINLLKAMNISGIWFDLKTGTFGEKFAITRTVNGSDHFSDLNPRISYDPITGRLMVYYNKIDYEDRWAVSTNISDDSTILPHETPAPLYGDIVNGYNVIAYRYADYDPINDEFVWNESYTPEEGLNAEQYYGQRFLELAPVAYINEAEHEIADETITVGQGESAVQVTLTHTGTMQTIDESKPVPNDPRIVEMDLTTHAGKAVFAYVMDYESDLQTPQDQQLYVQTYDYAAKAFSYPIEITNNSVQDTHPRFIQIGDDIYLYWLQDGDIVYTCISDLLTKDGKLKEMTVPGSGKRFYVIDKSNSAREAYVKKAVDHSNRIEEFQIASKDNTLYVFWTEDNIAYKNGLQPGDSDTADPANQYKERQIFAACSTAENNVRQWSQPVQVTTGNGANYSELSFIVPADEQFLAACAKYTEHYDENAGHFTDSNEIRDLVVSHFTINSQLELGEITTGADYPMPNTYVDAAVLLSNSGLKTFKNPYFQFYADVNGSRYYESEWLPPHQDETFCLPGGSAVTLKEQFAMPATLDGIEEMKLGFRVKNAAGEILAEKEKIIFIQPDLQINIMDSYLSGQDQAKLYLYVKNTGNKNFNDMLTIWAGDQLLHSQAVKLAVGEEQLIPLIIKLTGAAFGQLLAAEDGSRFDLLRLTCKFGEFEASTDVTRQISAAAWAELQQVESFSVNCQGNRLQNGGTMSINNNNQVSLQPAIAKKDGSTVLTGEAAGPKELEVVWSSSNPAIAYVTPDGVLVPGSLGSTIVTATLKPFSKQAVSGVNSAFALKDASYMLPAGVTEETSFTVNVYNASGGSSDSSSSKPVNVVPDQKLVSGNVPCVEKLEGDKLTLAMDEKLFAEAVKKITGTLSIKPLSSTGQIRQVATTLTANNLQSIAQSSVNRLMISSTLGSLYLNRKTIDAIAAAAASGKDAVIEYGVSDGIIEMLVKVEEKNIQNLNGGFLLLATPHAANKGEDSNSIVVYDLSDAARIVKASMYKPETGEILFRTDKPGRYSVSYNQVKFFDDLGWAEGYIRFLSSRNIVSGMGKGIFDKDKTVTRAEFVTMLARLNNDLQLADTAAHFADVPSNAWYAQYVKWAIKNGIVNGTSTTTFSPDKPISREEMAVMLKSYMNYAGISLVPGKTDDFKDKDAISTWSVEAINAMKVANIMNGTGENTFEPKRLSNRAEAAKVITEILKLFLK